MVICFDRFLHPITYGGYPKTMQSVLGNRLPKFTKSELVALKGSFDFLGMNYYTTNYVDAVPPATVNHSYYVDMQATLSCMLSTLILYFISLIN